MGMNRPIPTIDLLSTGMVEICGDHVANEYCKQKWREMYDFSPGAALLVMASQYYDEADYIRDYDEFLAFIKENKV